MNIFLICPVRIVTPEDTAIRFWLRHYLALHDGGPCKSCR